MDEDRDAIAYLVIFLSAILPFGSALIFNTRRQLLIYASLGIILFCAIFIDRPTGGPPLLLYFMSLVLIGIPAVVGLAVGAIVKAVSITHRERRNLREPAIKNSN